MDLKWAEDKVVCHHGTRPQVPTRAFSLKEGFIPKRPYVSIHLNSATTVPDPIDYYDCDARGLNIQTALNAMKVHKAPVIPY